MARSASPSVRLTSASAPSSYVDVHGEDFAEIKPDVVAEMFVRTLRLRFDVLVEFQHRGRLASFEDEMLRYDAFLTGSCPSPTAATSSLGPGRWWSLSRARPTSCSTSPAGPTRS